MAHAARHEPLTKGGRSGISRLRPSSALTIARIREPAIVGEIVVGFPNLFIDVNHVAVTLVDGLLGVGDLSRVLSRSGLPGFSCPSGVDANAGQAAGRLGRNDWRNGVHSSYDKHHREDPQVVGDGKEAVTRSYAVIGVAWFLLAL